MSQTINKEKSGIQLKQILLNESIYSLKDYENLPSPDSFNMNISFEHKINEDKINVKVTVSVHNEDASNKIGDTNLSILVSMTGLFVKENPLNISNEQFVKINAPAIIYPYIRQHIRTLSLESGIPPIILPIVNFVALYEANKSKEN
jgi:preprotein translocase subunit SecB